MLTLRDFRSHPMRAGLPSTRGTLASAWDFELAKSFGRYEVVLVNSNPATIMTDPGMADRTYIEPLTWEVVAKIIEQERPDALLPTLGGQTALNTAMALAKHGVLERFGVEMIGATADVIDKAEDRE